MTALSSRIGSENDNRVLWIAWLLCATRTSSEVASGAATHSECPLIAAARVSQPREVMNDQARFLIGDLHILNGERKRNNKSVWHIKYPLG
ncbi:hypothetical protein VCHC43B1_0315 [Vibrio cholerae HC-43B1]|nr:hypothetical protein VCHC43B1_0315 [Vibrio cholerae HC-43B1]BBC48091.1 hypothetical protein [Vibrio cholerae]